MCTPCLGAVREWKEPVEAHEPREEVEKRKNGKFLSSLPDFHIVKPFQPVGCIRLVPKVSLSLSLSLSNENEWEGERRNEQEEEEEENQNPIARDDAIWHTR
jgi:hypothetical protein